MRTSILARMIALAPVLAALSVSVRAQGPRPNSGKKPVPVPSGFDFPADEAALLRLRDDQNVREMRKHSWMVFAGMTQPTPAGEAIWETWYSAEETFGLAAPQALDKRSLQRRFESPKQFRPMGLHPQAVGASLASFTLFNQDFRQFVRKERLHLSSTQKKINDSFPANTPVEKREIPPFTQPSIALKTAWWLVKSSGMSVMPIWDPELNPPLPDGNPFNTWKRCVAVDPTRRTIPVGETTTQFCFPKSTLDKPVSMAVVPLSAFYHFKVNAAQAQAIKANPSFIPGKGNLAAGDYVALIAFHYTTKEIPDWVWSTFWWHDKPNEGPFAQDRTVHVKGVWRNYLMDTTFSMDTPAAADKGPNAAFNPWLEARFVDGTVSNCMTCHRRAVFSGNDTDFEFEPVTRGTPAKDDPRFPGATKLDFLWSLRMETAGSEQ
jgi:hypothetical protein